MVGAVVMANSVPMTTQQAIRALRMRGYSKRKIARELGIHRNTVGNYLEAEGSGIEGKCTTPTAGSAECAGAQGGGAAGPKCTTPTTGSVACEGRVASKCEPYRGSIEAKLGVGLTALRIWQDLVDEQGFGHSYQSVKRFVARLKAAAPERVWRMECEPGEELQVDYGTSWVKLGDRKRKVHVLRATLSHSRKGYTEAMLRQDTESFIRGLENAFRKLGGVTRMVVIDNLKAGVLKADFFDPQLNPKFASFCRHYGVTVLPTRPRTPEHKGKVENSVGYVKQSALKGREFAGLAELNAHLREWEVRVADKRIHGTTRKQVGAHFAAVERQALGPLPPTLFPCFTEGRRSVHRDSFVEFERAYYEVPSESIGREVWVRGDGRMVRLFNLRMEPVAVHAKLEPGRFSRTLGCGGVPESVAASLRYWQGRAARIGPEAGLWAEGLVARRKEAALRVLMGLVGQLGRRHGRAALERACGQARSHGHYRLADLKDWLERPDGQPAFAFLSEHEVIRDIADYGHLVGFQPNQ
jgi:transposase